MPTGALTLPEGGASRCRTSTGNAAELREAVVEATRLRFVRSDVPVGAYLSGGIDSSVTASAICHIHRSAALDTFSLRFADHEFDEGPSSR